MTVAPSAELVTPNPSPPIPDLVNNILGGKQYISPSYWLGWAAEQVCGVNPWSWLAEQFAGDWNAAAVAGEAVKHLAEFNQAYSEAVTNATKEVIPDYWSGNAATAGTQRQCGLPAGGRRRARRPRRAARCLSVPGVRRRPRRPRVAVRLPVRAAHPGGADRIGRAGKRRLAPILRGHPEAYTIAETTMGFGRVGFPDMADIPEGVTVAHHVAAGFSTRCVMPTRMPMGRCPVKTSR
jgi:hypothetical protein